MVEPRKSPNEVKVNCGSSKGRWFPCIGWLHGLYGPWVSTVPRKAVNLITHPMRCMDYAEPKHQNKIAGYFLSYFMNNYDPNILTHRILVMPYGLGNVLFFLPDSSKQAINHTLWHSPTHLNCSTSIANTLQFCTKPLIYVPLVLNNFTRDELAGQPQNDTKISSTEMIEFMVMVGSVSVVSVMEMQRVKIIVTWPESSPWNIVESINCPCGEEADMKCIVLQYLTFWPKK